MAAGHPELEALFGAGADAFRGAVDAFPDPTGVLRARRDAAGRIEELLVLYGNPAAERLLGVELGSGEPPGLLAMAPAARGRVFDAFCQVVETGEPWLGDEEFAGRAANRRLEGTFQIRAVRLGDGVLFLVRDVSERRAFEAEVERVQAIVDNTDDAILGADPTGHLTHWNRGAERLLGYTAEEALGMPLGRLVQAADREAQGLQFEAILRGRHIERIETRWVRRDRTLVDVTVTASPMVARDGTVLGVSGVVHDVTARRRAEAELHRSNAELRRFADVAAHDLREPLAAVGRFAEVLGGDPETALGPRGREALGYLTLSAERARRLVDGLREYAQVGRGEPVRRPVDLGELLGRLLPTLGTALDEAGAQVDAGDLPVVSADPDELGRVLQNLILNAVKFRGAQPPQVAVTAARAAGGWMVAVTDNGSGIAPADAERVFEIFTRGVGDEVPGTGIGLAVCQKIVERHGGRIWVEPAPPPGGTSVRFTIADVHADEAPTP